MISGKNNTNEQQEFDINLKKEKNTPVVNVELNVFTGPLDALYNLVIKHKIEILEISLTEITKQFIEFTKNHPTMELSGEFLELTTRLIYLKSASILKKDRDAIREMEIKAEEEEIAKQLLLKLQEYKKYKEASINITKMLNPITKSYFKNRPEIIIKEVFDLSSITKENLYNAILELAALELNKELNEKLARANDSKLNKIYRDKFLSVEHKIDKIEHLLEEKDILNFFDIVKKDNKMDKVVTFLALLEMCKGKQVKLYQERTFADLIIEKNSIDENQTDNGDVDLNE